MVEFTKELDHLLGICLTSSTSYHPQMDGQTEHINMELEQYLCGFVNECQDDWEDLLPLAEFQCNNHVHASLQHSPFMLDTGWHPCMGFKPVWPSKLETVNEFWDCMEAMLEEAKAALAKAKDDMACFYNHQWDPAPVFQPGDKVYLDASDIHTNCPSQKLSHRHLGPFVVEAAVGSHAYCLWLPPSMCGLHPVFPVVKLTPCPPDPIPGHQAQLPPPPVVVSDQVEYEVEKILNSQV